MSHPTWPHFDTRHSLSDSHLVSASIAARPRSLSSDLANVADRLLRVLEEHGLVVTHDAVVHIGRLPRIEMTHSSANESEFVRVVTAIDARVVCLERHCYEQQLYDEAIEAANRLPTPPERRARLAALEPFASHIGALYSFEFTAIAGNGTVTVHYHAYAPWADDAAFAPEEDESAAFRRGPDLSAEERTLVNAAARRMAENPRFQDAKHGMHTYVGELLLKEENVTLPGTVAAHEIISHAHDIWFAELKPKRDEDRRARARQLRDQGWTKVKIAADLGVTTRQLDNLL